MIDLELHSGMKAVIFDLDGTLANSIPLHIKSWHIACNSFNYKFDESIIPKLTGQPTVVFAEYIRKDSGCKLSANEIMDRKLAYFYQFAHTIKPHQKVAEFVQKYHGKIPMSIGTGGGSKCTKLILEAIGMNTLFDKVVTADDVTRHKPEPDTFLKCAELMGIEPQFCQVFEDGELGMQAARNAGMLVVDVRPFY